MTFLLIGIFIIFMLLGVPIAFAMMSSTAVTLLALGQDLTLIPQKLFSGIDNFVYLSIPFFVLAGELMSNGGITKRIVVFCRNLVGHIPGSLAHVNVLASMMFAGLSGSALADAGGLGRIEMDMMSEAGFDKEFSSGITAASSVVGPIIPPSLVMIIFCIAAQSVPVTTMFAAGVLPGLLLSGSLLILCWFFAKRRRYPVDPEFAGWRAVGKSLLETLPALVLPPLMLLCIVSGVTTPTEAAIIAVIYSLFVSVVLYRTMTWKILFACLTNTMKTTVNIYLIIGVSASMGWAITTLNIPSMVGNALMSISHTKVVFLILANMILLVMGMFMDNTPSILIMTPILMPVAVSFGVHPVHLGIIIVVNLCIGLITPPVGPVLYVTANVAQVPLSRLFREIYPFVAAEILVLMIITFIPGVSLFLPELLGLL